MTNPRERKEGYLKLKGWYSYVQAHGMTNEAKKQFRCMMSRLTPGQRNRLQNTLAAAVPVRDVPDFITKVGPTIQELLVELRTG